MLLSRVILDVIRTSWEMAIGQCKTVHACKYFTRFLPKPLKVLSDKCTNIKVKHKLLNDSKY